MAFFIVLWTNLLITKLRCLQKNNIGDTNIYICTHNTIGRKYLDEMAGTQIHKTQMHKFTWIYELGIM